MIQNKEILCVKFYFNSIFNWEIISSTNFQIRAEKIVNFVIFFLSDSFEHFVYACEGPTLLNH